MAKILCSLRDGGELSLMNGDNNPDGINLPRLWLLFFRIGKTYRVTSRSDDNNNHHSSKVGTTTTPQVTAYDSPTRSRRHARGKNPGKISKCSSDQKKYKESKQPLTELALRLITEKYKWAKLALV